MAKPVLDFTVLEKDMPRMSVLRHENATKIVETQIHMSDDQKSLNDAYTHHIRHMFDVACDFLIAHKHPRTNDDWVKILDAVSALGDDPLMKDLREACLSELEREYLQSE